MAQDEAVRPTDRVSRARLMAGSRPLWRFPEAVYDHALNDPEIWQWLQPAMRFNAKSSRPACRGRHRSHTCGIRWRQDKRRTYVDKSKVARVDASRALMDVAEQERKLEEQMAADRRLALKLQREERG